MKQDIKIFGTLFQIALLLEATDLWKELFQEKFIFLR